MMLKSSYHIIGLMIIANLISISFQEIEDDSGSSHVYHMPDRAPEEISVRSTTTVPPKTMREKNNSPRTSLKNIVDKANKGYTFAEDIGFFKISDKKKTWFQAFTECEKDSGFLAIPDTKGEIKLLTDMLKRTGPTEIFDLYHIGLHKLNTNGRWFDVKSKLYSLGQDYNAKKSNLTSYDATMTYNCGALWYNGHFYDVPCSHPARYICEIPLVASNINKSY